MCWRWLDYKFIDGYQSDVQRDIGRVSQSIATLDEALDNPQSKGKKLCVVTHMLPTRALVHPGTIPAGIAYLGSERLRHFYEQKGVSLSVCGHSHMRGSLRQSGVQYENVSLGYNFQWKNFLNLADEIKKTMLILEDEEA